MVIGAGAAGCVLASKLSEDKNVTVLILEAGGDNRKVFETKVPLMFPKLFHTQHDWDYYTVEQPGLANRQLYWPRGKSLGGSTSLNAMMYHHCSKSDFDEWAEVYGCAGWNYDDLVPYLRGMERFTANPRRPAIDSQHRGTSGQWQTGYSWLSDIVENGFLPACEDARIPAIVDVNTCHGNSEVTKGDFCNVDQDLSDEHSFSKHEFSRDLEKRGLLSLLTSGKPIELGFSMEHRHVSPTSPAN